MEAAINTSSRWDKLLPVIALTLILALVGVVMLPVNPRLEVYLHVLLLPCIVALALTRFRSDTWRKLPGYDDLEYDSQGNRIQGKRPKYHGAFLGTSLFFAAIAEINLIQEIFSPHYKYNYILPSVTAYLVLSIISLGVTAALGPARTQRLEKAVYGSGNVIKRLVALGIVVTVALAIYALSLQIFRNPTHGRAAPWEKLLAFAQDQARGIDGAALLASVEGRPPYDASLPFDPHNTLLEVDFEFIRPSGRSIRVTVLDTDPPRMLAIRNPGYSGGWLYSSDTLSDYERRLATIKLEPRDVWRLTEGEALAYSKEKGFTVSPGLRMRLHYSMQELFGVPVVWTIEYMSDRPAPPASLDLRVDAGTGKIVARERWPEDLNKKQTPVPIHTPSP